MADIKWSAFPDGGEITSGDEVVGLRAGANVRLTANAFDNLLLDTNTISSTDTDGNINLDPDGAGLVVIQGSTGIDAVIDDDTMATASATNVPTSESVVAYIASEIGSAAGGSNTQIQYNNSGALGGDSGFTTDGSGSLTVTGDLSVDNLNLNGNSIISIDTDGDINLSPDGAGSVVINTDLDVDNLNLDGNTITGTGAVNLRSSTGSLTFGDGTASAQLMDFAGSGTQTSNIQVTNNACPIRLFNRSATNNNYTNIDGYNASNLIVSRFLTKNVSHAGRTADYYWYLHNGSSFTNVMYLSNGGNLTVGNNITATAALNGASLQVDNININGNTISSTDTNGDINLTPDGAGQVVVTNAISAASGINFGNETLSEYDEGTFTPTFSFDTPGDLGVVYTRQIGGYTRIGRMVYITMDRDWETKENVG